MRHQQRAGTAEADDLGLDVAAHRPRPADVAQLADRGRDAAGLDDHARDARDAPAVVGPGPGLDGGPERREPRQEPSAHPALSRMRSPIERSAWSRSRTRRPCGVVTCTLPRAHAVVDLDQRAGPEGHAREALGIERMDVHGAGAAPGLGAGQRLAHDALEVVAAGGDLGAQQVLGDLERQLDRAARELLGGRRALGLQPLQAGLEGLGDLGQGRRAPGRGAAGESTRRARARAGARGLPRGRRRPGRPRAARGRSTDAGAAGGAQLTSSSPARRGGTRRTPSGRARP